MARRQRRNTPRPPAAEGPRPGAERVATRVETALPQAWPWLFCASVAAWLSVSQLHRNHIADSLLPSLISTMKWTPFFWRQNRYGMLWPLVCSWIHHPLYNVVAVMFCNVTFGLAAHFLLARFLWRRGGPWQWTGLVSVAATMALGSERFVFETLSPLQFMTSPLALGLTALYLLECGARDPWRLILAAASLALTAWYNPAATILLGALLFWAVALELGPRLARGGMGARPAPAVLARTAACFAAVGATAALAIFLMRHAQWHNPVFDQGLPLSLWPASFWALCCSMFTPTGDDMGSPLLAACVGATVIAGSLVVAGAGSDARGPAWQAAWRRSAAGLLAAVSYGLVVSQRAWARQEHYNARYFYPVLFVGVSAACVLLVGMVRAARPGERAGDALEGIEFAVAPVREPARVSVGAGLSLCFAVFALVGLRFGPPSYAGVEAWMVRYGGTVGQELVDTGCTHVTGRYWDAWPAAFYVNWQRYLRGDTRPFFAISNYAEPTSEMWSEDVSTWRVGIIKASVRDAQFYLERYRVPELILYGETPHLHLAAHKLAARPRGSDPR